MLIRNPTFSFGQKMIFPRLTQYLSHACVHQQSPTLQHMAKDCSQICQCHIALDLKSKENITSCKQLHLYKQNFDTEDIHDLLSIHWSFPIYPERERAWKNIYLNPSRKMLVCLLITSVFQFQPQLYKEKLRGNKERESSVPA